jgi:thioredoxin reductase
VRDAVGDVPVGIRVTSDEFVVGGTVLDEAIEAVDLLLSQTQIDYVSVSVSNYASIETMIPDMSFPRQPFVENAAAIRKVARGVPVMTVGRIVTPENAEELLSTGTADLVCIVRPLIADPEWTNKALDGKRNRIRECISCNVGCRGGPHRGTPIACLVNPAVGYERTMGVGTLTTATHAKHVVVVGGGPGGLKAAETAALRGHRVTVVEKQARTGGMVVTAAATMPYRAEFAGSVTWLHEECERLGVQIITGKEATPEFLTSLKAEIVVLATGARPGRPAVDGVDLPHVYSVPDAIHSEVKGHHVAVVDCGEADWKSLTTAECLAARGHRVTVVSPAPAAAEIDAFSKPTLLRRLAAAKVDILEHRSLVSIQERNLTLVHGWSKQSETLPEVDAVVLSWYGVANDELRLTLEKAGFDVHLVGDCLAPRRAIDAIWDGYRLGSTL